MVPTPLPGHLQERQEPGGGLIHCRDNCRDNGPEEGNMKTTPILITGVTAEALEMSMFRLLEEAGQTGTNHV